MNVLKESQSTNTKRVSNTGHGFIDSAKFSTKSRDKIGINLAAFYCH